jgi:hypothetical protein
MFTLLLREVAEAITNPTYSDPGYFAEEGLHAGDICEAQYGKVHVDPGTGAAFNTQVGSRPYLLPMLWDPVRHHCAGASLAAGE